MKNALTYCLVTIGTLTLALTTFAEEPTQETEQVTTTETLPAEQNTEKTASVEEEIPNDKKQDKTKNKKKSRKSKGKTDKKKTSKNQKSKKSKSKKSKSKTPTVVKEEKSETTDLPETPKNSEEESLPEDSENSNKYGE